MSAPARERPEVSVVIPAFNAQSSVCRALDSVLNQSLTGVEVLVVDDGSTDATVQTLESHISALGPSDRQRVRLLRRPQNGGYSRALRDGLEAAHGHWTWCHDADDLADPHALSRLRRAAEEFNAEMAVCRMSYVDESGSQLRLVPQRMPRSRSCTGVEALLMLADGSFNAFLANKLIHRSLWSRLWHWPVSTYSDMELVFQLLVGCRTVAHVDKPLYHYTIRVGSITAGLNEGMWDLRGLPGGYGDALRRAGVRPRRAASSERMFRYRQVYWPILNKTSGAPASALRDGLYEWAARRVRVRDLLRVLVSGRRGLLAAACVGSAATAPSAHARALRLWKAARG